MPRVRGFTLIELMVVVAIIAIAAGVASLAIRDPAGTTLEREGERLAALLDSARAESRSMGSAVQWQPVGPNTPAPADGDSASANDNFRFIGLPPTVKLPTRWLTEGVHAEVVGAPTLKLGPDAIIPPQRVVLTMGEQRVVVGTDSLGPFQIVDGEPAS